MISVFIFPTLKFCYLRHLGITAKDIHFCNELTYRCGIIKTLSMKSSFNNKIFYLLDHFINGNT